MFQIREVPDVYADACVRNTQGELVFLSCFGRDTALQQMFAAFSLKPQEGGLPAITLVSCNANEADANLDSYQHNASITDRLIKFTGRLPKQNLFGNLIHAWVFDPVVQKPDMVNRSAWRLVARFDESYASDKSIGTPDIWEMVKQLSPVPLMDHWKKAVLAKSSDLVTDLQGSAYPPLGRVAASRVAIPDDFAERISKLVRTGAVSLADQLVPLLKSKSHSQITTTAPLTMKEQQS